MNIVKLLTEHLLETAFVIIKNLRFQTSGVNCSTSFLYLQGLKDTYDSVCLTKAEGLRYENLIKKKTVHQKSFLESFRNFQTIDFSGHTSEQLPQGNHENEVKTHSAKAIAKSILEFLEN